MQPLQEMFGLQSQIRVDFGSGWALGLSRFLKLWDSESILYSKKDILFVILWPKAVRLNQFSILGNRNQLSPSGL